MQSEAIPGTAPPSATIVLFRPWLSIRPLREPEFARRRRLPSLCHFSLVIVPSTRVRSELARVRSPGSLDAHVGEVRGKTGRRQTTVNGRTTQRAATAKGFFSHWVQRDLD